MQCRLHRSWWHTVLSRVIRKLEPEMVGFLGHVLIGFLPVDNFYFGRAIIVVLQMAHFAHGGLCLTYSILALRSSDD